jgi:hypothetical protein
MRTNIGTSSRIARRRQTGGTVVELGPVLWFLFFFLFFPLLDLATLGLNYTFLMQSSRDAAQAASIAKTYLADLNSSQMSAVNIANARARYYASSWKGISVVRVDTYLLTTDVATKSFTRQQLPLSSPPDTARNLYQIEVVVTGDINPLMRYAGPLFGNIPGFTKAYRCSIATEQLFENTDGLTQ